MEPHTLYFPAAATEPLFRLLDAGMSYRLTLVLAPAGAGKTALLRRWLAARDWPAAWVALDAADDGKAHFVQHLVAATQDLFAPALLAQGEPRTVVRGEQAELVADDVLAAWLNALAELDGDLALVLDGYEQIEAPAVHDAVRLMLDYSPPGLHLFITARAEPPLQLPRLRVRRQLLEIALGS